jgi:hypothetical protein
VTNQDQHLAGAPFPLYWPEGWPRSPSRRASKYDRAFARDRDAVIRRLRRMGATGITISSNVPLRRDGLPMANTAQPADPGVAVYFTRRKREHVVACDAWKTVDENLRAVLRTIEALHAIERSGSAQIEDRAYQGFARLPAQAGRTVAPWRVVLGMVDDEIVTLELAEHAYRLLAKKVHPDAPGGSHEAFLELQRAIEEARKELR